MILNPGIVTVGGRLGVRVSPRGPGNGLTREPADRPVWACAVNDMSTVPGGLGRHSPVGRCDVGRAAGTVSTVSASAVPVVRATPLHT